jgi:endonuclease/exonuclease/phosphatase family metal-dependent hydrolase
MPALYRKITKKFVIIANIILAVFFLFSCFSFYLDPVTFWYFALMGFLFPYLLFAVLVFLVVWSFFKSKWVILNIILLIIGWQNINAVFAWNLFAKKFKAEKQTGAIRVMQWNSMCFGENLTDRVKGSEIRDKMLDYIKTNDPDIICLQEFYDSDLPQFNNNVAYLTNNLGFPNYCYSRDYVRQVKNSSNTYNNIGFLGTAIFTNLPIADSGTIRFASIGQKNLEAICFLDVIKNEDTIRVFTTHLQSINLKKTEYDEIYQLKDANETGLKASRNVFAKVKRAYTYRKEQSELLRLQIDASPYPVIICGDFNDIPNSYTYHTIKGNLKDVFLKKGFGIGRTFSAISPTLRIDYILTDKRFRVIQAKKENKNLSDHYPILADLELMK